MDTFNFNRAYFTQDINDNATDEQINFYAEINQTVRKHIRQKMVNELGYGCDYIPTDNEITAYQIDSNIEVEYYGAEDGNHIYVVYDCDIELDSKLNISAKRTPILKLVKPFT